MMTDQEDLKKFVESVKNKKIRWDGQHGWKPGEFFRPDGRFFLESGDWLMGGLLTRILPDGSLDMEPRHMAILDGFSEHRDYKGISGLNGRWAFVNIADAMISTLSDVKVPEDLKNFKFKHKCLCSLDQIFKGGCACGGI